MNVIDHQAYILDVERAVGGADSWAWTDTPDHIDEDDIEICEAPLALGAIYDQAKEGKITGRIGVIAFPDGQGLAWIESEGWQWLDEDGYEDPIFNGKAASPKQLAALARRRECW